MVKIGVARETLPGERRVALVADSVKRLVAKGHTVFVESGAGQEAFVSNAAYQDVGAEIVANFSDLVSQAEVIVKVRPPSTLELDALREGQVVVGMLQPLTHLDMVSTLENRGVTSFSLDALPRISRAQSMDVLSSQATVSGYRAVVIGTYYLPKLFPLLMTAAGTITPARVLILGVGVAGLQAIATAKRLGAQVQAFDTRPAVKEQVESLGASFLTLPLTVAAAETAGGYARQLDEDIEAQERDLLKDPVAAADVIITTAMVPGARAPQLISESMVQAMKPGSVIVDLAAESGGNCALTRRGSQWISPDGVLIEGSIDVPSQVPAHASQLYGHNIQEFLSLLFQVGVHQTDSGTLDWTLDQDEIIQTTCITHAHRIVHSATLERSHA